MKKVKFIYNPFSGENLILNNLDTIIKLYQGKNLQIIPFRISLDTPLEKAFIDIDETYDHILAAGGDGTINQVVNLMKNNNLDLPLAVLPVGTANDFAKLIGATSDIEENCKKILNSTPKPVDLGLVNDKYFINVFSYGLFTDVSQKTPTHLKNIFGKLAYYYSGIKELPTFKSLNIEVQSEEMNYSGEALIFFVFNGKTAGNINIAYNSEITDGLLDVIIVKPGSIISTISSLLKFFKGEHLEESTNLIHFKTANLKVNCKDFNNNNITTDIDGEPGPEFPLTITCLTNSLNLIF